jgi:hypothetical protein
MVAMTLAIVAQAAVIVVLLTRPAPQATASVTIESAQPGDEVIVNGQKAGHTPLQLNVGTGVQSLRVVSVSGRAGTRVTAAGAATKSGKAAAHAETVGVRVASAIELKVFEGARALGSSADGVIGLAPGVHELDLVNDAVGFRVHRTVTVGAGAPLTIDVPLPDGAIRITSDPPSSVVLDKKALGEAPLQAVTAMIGEHEVVLRHPTLGEVRRSVLVKPGETTEVSVKLGQ